MKNKILCLVLALLMLIPLSACSKERPMEGDGTSATADHAGNGTADPNGNDTNGGNGGTSGNEDPVIRSDKPDPTDLDDYEYRVNVRSSRTGNGGFSCEDFWVEKMYADKVLYAVYQRNKEIEKDFNVTIIQVDSEADQAEELRAASFGGIKYESAIVESEAAATLAAEGLLTDLNSLDNLHLEKSCWDANSVHQLSLGGKLYFVSGDNNINTMDNSVVTVFNKDLLKDYPDMESPYDMVRNNTWTMNNMMAMAKTATVDFNGDGMDADDIAGYFSYATSGLYYFYAAGERISTNDADDYPVMTVLSDTSVDVVEGLFRMLNPKFNPRAIKGDSKERKAMFEVNHVLFTDMLLWDVRKQFSPLTIDYGLVPPPKYNSETQDEYCSVIYFQDCVHLWTLPNEHKDTEKASLMMEVFAAYSTDTTMAAYYGQALSYQSMRDPESIEMLDVVKKSQTYDIGLLYDWGGFKIFLRNITGFETNSFSTKCDGSLESATNLMNETLSKFKNGNTGNNGE